MQKINWSTEPNFEQNIVLDNIVYTMAACWNVRNETWAFSLSTIDGVMLVTNKQANLLINLLRDVNSELKPAGKLVVAPSNLDINQVITRDNFDVDVELLYIRDDELLQ